ncbi:hypothetical protein [Bosea sp. BK604]|uniref:hypothetical protein n=1 Tax=Bosea sp. BK604 TaxID=2512180 RepID=UPI0010462DA5|nr:hypothetical protein [Bosea sp. BK604]TCR66287.1 hypothetical protein EV560_104165 [Bosea sp. BK604]
MIASTFGSLTRLTRIAGTATLIVLVQPALAADFQIDNLKFDFGGAAITVPKIAVKGSPLEREAFIALFNATTGESTASRMSRLGATEITAPELSIVQELGAQKQTTIYRDIRFSEIRDGRIARGEAAGGTLAVTGAPTGTMTGELKRMGFEGMNLRQIARVFSEKAAPGVEEQALPLYDRFEMDGYALDLGAAGKMSMGKASGRAFKVKVGSEPLGELFSRIVAQAEADQKSGRDPTAKRTPEQTEADKRIGLALLSLFETVDYGSGEVRDVAMNIVTPPKPNEKPVAVTMKIARMAYGEDTPTKSGFALEGFDFATEDAKGTIGLISYSGFSFGSTIKGWKDVLSQPDADFDNIDYRSLIPTLGTIRLTGLTAEAPQKGAKPGQALPPLRIGLGTFEIKASDQLNGIPTNLAMTIDKLQVPVVEGPGNPAVRDLIAMGYRNLDLSAKLDLGWNAGSNELAIRNIAVGGAGMGQLQASGTLGNVTKDLFSSDTALAQIAALGATARNVQAKLQNLGLFEKLVENEARKSNRKPDEVKRQYAMMASLGLAAILGPSDGAKTLAAAVSRFVAQPGTLTVEATAKTASGLGLADVIAIADPTEIFDKINLKANAQ